LQRKDEKKQKSFVGQRGLLSPLPNGDIPVAIRDSKTFLDILFIKISELIERLWFY